jgi:acid phosphatase (class A)
LQPSRPQSHPRLRRESILRLTPLLLVAGFALALAPAARSQSTGTKQVAHLSDETRQDVTGYMKGAEPNYLTFVPPYSVLNSDEDKLDVATFERMQVPESSALWKLAEADEEMKYSRFNAAVSLDLDAVKFPIVIHLLDRMERDVMDTAFAAKVHFNRPRPFERFQVAHVCGDDSPPVPEANPQRSRTLSSYPSGHAAFGWGLALTLAEIAPDHAQAILTRGREYAENRVICGVHFPSDVAAGEIAATAVVERLHTNAEFAHDLTCAAEEVRAATEQGAPLSQNCAAMEKQYRGSVNGKTPAK